MQETCGIIWKSSRNLSKENIRVFIIIKRGGEQLNIHENMELPQVEAFHCPNCGTAHAEEFIVDDDGAILYCSVCVHRVDYWDILPECAYM